MVSTPELLLEETGVKLMEMVHDDPAVSVVPQLLAKMPKLLALVPPIAIPAMLSVPLPVFVSVTVCGAVLVPNPMDEGLTTATGSAMPVPLIDAVC
jgi:hypothetical protein